MNGILQLDVHVVTHLMAGDAELLGIGGLQRGVEPAPEDDPGDEATKREKTQAVMHAWAAQNAPVLLEQGH